MSQEERKIHSRAQFMACQALNDLLLARDVTLEVSENYILSAFKKLAIAAAYIKEDRQKKNL